MNDIITFNNKYCQVIHKFKDCDYEVQRSCMEMSRIYYNYVNMRKNTKIVEKSAKWLETNRFILEPQGSHSIVKLNTMCETILLPLYYMA
jgi:hypothetical protein